jgi:hypothetical protein
MKKTYPVALALIAVIGLAGCTADSETDNVRPTSSSTATAKPAPSASPTATSAPTPSDSAKPAPAPSAPEPKPEATAAVASVPNDCKAVVPQSKYTGFFGETPLNDPGFVGEEGGEYYTPTGAIKPSDAPTGATAREKVESQTELRCIWRDPRADISGLSVEMASIEPAISKEYMASLASDGFKCEAVDNGQRCQETHQEAQYGVDVANTVFVRDSTVITIWQANFPTNNLLKSLTSTVWK